MMRLAIRLDHLRARVTLRSERIPALEGARIVRAASGDLRVLARGRGRVGVVLMADPPLGLEHYLPLIEVLASRWRVLAFEVPGFGFSAPAPEFDFSLEAYAASIGDVLAEDDVERVILAPACFAGLPALRFALDSPERVAGFVGVQTPDWEDAKAWIKRNDKIGLFAVPVAGQLLCWATSRWLEKLWLDIAEPDQVRRERLMEEVRERFGRGAIYCLASGLQATRRPDPFAGERLTVPSAILWGNNDGSHRPTKPSSFARYLAEPKVFTVP